MLNIYTLHLQSNLESSRPKRSMPEKRVHINFKLPKNWFDLKKIGLSDFQEMISFLRDAFGFRYTDIFATEILNTNQADNIYHTYQTLHTISNLAGFSRFVKLFNRNDSSGYLFSARTAALLKNKFDVELEPITENNGRMPDLKVKIGSKPVFIECKTIDINKFYQKAEKKEIAKSIRSKIQTPNQITVFFNDSESIKILRKKLIDKQFVKQILITKNELDLQTKEGLHINVIPRMEFADPDYFGYMQMIMEDNISGERKPGFVFQELGHSTGVFGPLIDFSSCLEKKRGKSRTQYVEGYPYILAIDASNILGDPSQNLRYIRRWFQPNINTRYSGILLCRMFSRNSNSYSVELDYLKNDYSRYSIDAKLERFFQEKAKQV